MKGIMLLIPALILFSSVLSGTSTQTDWSGGPGGQSPISDWTNTFCSNTGTNWSSLAGSLDLSVYGVVRHIIASERVITHVHATDMDGDGDSDIIFSTARRIALLENDWYPHPIDSCLIISSISTADLDADGRIDIIASSERSNRIYWWHNPDRPGAAWTRREICSFPSAYCVSAVDVDRDGDIDVVGAGEFGIAWWENTDPLYSPWTYHSLAGSYSLARSMDSDDIDGDGDMDVVAASDSNITWWENIDGAGIDWSSYNLTDSFGTIRSVSIGDLDNDGDGDILAASFTCNSITWWKNEDGHGTDWSVHSVDNNVPFAQYVCSADLDADGDLDVAGAGGVEHNTLSWWENESGSGAAWVRHDLTSDYRIRALATGSFGGDSSEDIVVTMSAIYPYQHSMVWYNVHSFELFGCLVSSILNTGHESCWGSIDWAADTPVGTSVTFRVRASNDHNSMGEWSDLLTEPCSLSSIVGNGGRYFQYYALLQTDDVDLSPTLLDISLSWDSSSSVPRDPEPGFFPLTLLPFAPNPVTGTPFARYSLPFAAPVSFTVHDICGRLLEQIDIEESSTGNHLYDLTDLPPGVYFCRMTSGDFAASQRFVVIE